MKLKDKYIKLDKINRLNNLDVPVIALTGGIATGKSSVSKLLTDLGMPVIDADKNVKSIYASKEGFDFVKKKFPEVIQESSINFTKLREVVFANQKTKVLVENFIYQRLPDQFLKEYSKLGKPEYIFYDVPLLFEKSLDKFVDSIVTVYCPRNIQLERLLKRDGINKELAENILSAQEDIEYKKKNSTFVIDNSGTIESLEKQVKDFLAMSFSN